jgi:RNA polymerase sigma-70 factor (ECF subfamily)
LWKPFPPIVSLPQSDPAATPAPSVSRWFSEEVQPHEASLRAYLRHSLSSLADVDDLVQECYARLLRERDRGEVRSNRAFLFAVARNAVRDLIRRRAVADAMPITENVTLPVLEEGANVVALVSRREELAILTEAIQALPERCRHVFLLRKIQGLSQKEIAARLGITENTVETLVAKGARRCADHLRAHGVGPGFKP